ncbi:hypothetical protein ABE438_13020 [Bosea sp. TWI1241]|uniref:hypothetical protein n=1 Tax=Bosea sp. TWI1241 TaxID=3148904 RepID=UPI00320AA68F
MTRFAAAGLTVLMSLSAAQAAFETDPTFIVTTLDKGTLAPDLGTMPVPAAAEPIVEAYKASLAKDCRAYKGTAVFKADFATAVDVNGDGRADIFMTSNRMNCGDAPSVFAGTAGTAARWELSKADGSYAIVDQLHHRVEIQQTLKNGYQLIVHLHGMNCGKAGAEQCRHVVNVGPDGTIRTIAWPDNRHRDIAPAPAAKAPPAPATVQTVASGREADPEAFATAGHNGSDVEITDTQIVYTRPKASLRGVVKPGTVLVEGRWNGDRFSGTAYAFKQGCAPAPYPVSGGHVQRPGRLDMVLTGAGPLREGCAVVGYSQKSPHSRLVFDQIMSN